MCSGHRSRQQALSTRLSYRRGVPATSSGRSTTTTSNKRWKTWTGSRVSGGGRCTSRCRSVNGCSSVRSRQASSERRCRNGTSRTRRWTRCRTPAVTHWSRSGLRRPRGTTTSTGWSRADGRTTPCASRARVRSVRPSLSFPRFFYTHEVGSNHRFSVRDAVRTSSRDCGCGTGCPFLSGEGAAATRSTSTHYRSSGRTASRTASSSGP